MKVIQINTECGRGSTGKIAVAISRCLSKNGIENKIYYSANHKSDYPLGEMIGSKPMLRLHQILSRIFGDQGFHSYFSTKKLVKRIKKDSPDVILLHNIHGYYLHMKVLFRFLKEYDKPVLWTLHDCWAFTGHCSHYTMIGCDRWKSGCGSCPQKSAYPYSLFFDRSKKLFQIKKELFCSVNLLTLITPSQWLADELKKSFFGSIPNYVIHNGIDLGIFHPVKGDFRQKYHLENKIVILGVSSVWTDSKGLDIFIDLAKRLPPQKYAVVLVGTNASVEAMLPPNVVSVCRVQNQLDLAQIYSAADVFVNPTRQDTFPTVNMEAVACGTPVITFDTGGCSETVAEGCGIIIQEKTVDAIIGALDGLCPKTESISRSCADIARCFDENDCFEEYVRLCREQL